MRSQYLNSLFRQSLIHPISPFIFSISLHKDMIERLPLINKKMANKVRVVLEENKAERHIRGGEATRKKYKNVKASL